MWIWLLPLLSIFWGWMRIKDAATGWDGDLFVIRSRFLSKSTAYIKKKRIQDFSLHQSFFQRYRGLCSMKMYVASGDHGKSFGVSDLELDDGFRALNEARKENSVKIADIKLREIELKDRLVHLPGWA
jgi:putative membrane protein